MILRTRNLDPRRKAGPAHKASSGLAVGAQTAESADSEFARNITLTRRSALRGAHAFTLLELLLVLALLAMAVAVAAPSLARFFHGRALDSEARRLLALTRYAQSRAVSEGVPMVMWFKPEEGTYGLEAESTYTGTDPKAIEFQLDSNLELELAPPTPNQATPWKITTEIAGSHPAIRFTPDGFVSETSPAWVWLKISKDDEPDAVWLALNDNRLKYELQTIQPTR